MSAAHRKDRLVGIGIWKAPLNLSKGAFEIKFMSLLDSLLALPVAHKNYLKILQKDALNQPLLDVGIPVAPSSVWWVVEGAV
ncbi:hypothetical protein DFH08DRAFT_975370 [Mycena albidolilacea]|uniref:Uncharacterized protein n=1 Tax=Mycena albidolilacea TaxID=1033008 RepID=A0AAD6Z4M2_9AGAR|nr:hypothetical protein DFH08DRAFT_975370 [Mycena albidolilacea]